MKIEKLSYQITVPVASFQYDKIGIEASVDSDKEDISECFAQLRKTLDGLARETYPHLYSENKNDKNFTPSEIFNWSLMPPPSTEKEKFSESELEQNTISGIETCKELPMLMTYRFVKDKWDSTKSAYNKKYKELAK